LQVFGGFVLRSQPLHFGQQIFFDLFGQFWPASAAASSTFDSKPFRSFRQIDAFPISSLLTNGVRFILQMRVKRQPLPAGQVLWDVHRAAKRDAMAEENYSCRCLVYEREL